MKNFIKKIIIRNDGGDYRVFISIFIRFFYFCFYLKRSLKLLFESKYKKNSFIIVYVPPAGHILELIGELSCSNQTMVLLDCNSRNKSFRYKSIYLPGANNFIVHSLAYLLKGQEVHVLMQSNSRALNHFRKIFHKFDKKYFGDEAINASLDRYFFYDCCSFIKTFKVPIISFEKAKNLLSEGSRIVLKRRDTQGSKGVSIIDDASELFKVAQASENKDFILEQFIEGQQFSVDVLVNQNGLQIYDITRQYFNSRLFGNSISPALAVFNYDNDRVFETKFRAIAEEISVILKIKSFAFNFECIVNKEEVFVIDIQVRVGADWPFLYGSVANDSYVTKFIQCVKGSVIDDHALNNPGFVLIRANQSCIDTPVFKEIMNNSVHIRKASGYYFYLASQETTADWIKKIEELR